MFDIFEVFVGVVIVYQLSGIIKLLKYNYQVSRIELVDRKFINTHTSRNFIRYRAKFEEENKQTFGWVYIDKQSDECYLFTSYLEDYHVGTAHFDSFRNITSVEFNDRLGISNFRIIDRDFCDI